MVIILNLFNYIIFKRLKDIKIIITLTNETSSKLVHKNKTKIFVLFLKEL